MAKQVNNLNELLARIILKHKVLSYIVDDIAEKLHVSRAVARLVYIGYVQRRTEATLNKLLNLEGGEAVKQAAAKYDMVNSLKTLTK